MSINPEQLTIVVYPAPVLRTRASPIEAVTDEVREVARRMFQLMHEAEGIGLAANQVGLAWRLFVADVPHSDDPEDERSLLTDPVSATERPTVYINPVLKDHQRDLVPFEEGCLSLPDIRGDVRRPSAVTIEALGLDGKPFRQRASGLLARCWQHEMDHLDGVLILDRMSQVSRLKNKAAISELEQRPGKGGLG